MRNNGSASSLNFPMPLLNHLYFSFSQAMINLWLRQLSILNAWSREFQATLWRTAPIGKWMQFNFTELTISKSFCLFSSNTDIAFGVFLAAGMLVCLIPTFTTLLCRKCPRTKEEPWETQLRPLFLRTNVLKQSTCLLGLQILPALIEWWKINKNIYIFWS